MTTSLFDIFKMIFGIVASITILVFVLRYAGTYSSTQKQLQNSIILEDFMKTAENVYLTGEAETFSGFLKTGKPSFSPDPPSLKAGNAKARVNIPLLFSSGEKILITRASLDYGWWRFDAVLATPQMYIIFSFPEGDRESISMASFIAESIPSSSGYEPNITFGICSGSSVEGFWDYFDLSSNLLQEREYSACTAKPSENARLVVISPTCRPPARGICIHPEGKAYIAGSEKEYEYSDFLDILSLIMGGSKKDVFGIPEAEKVYKYKNIVFKRHAFIAADIYTSSLSFIRSEIEKTKKEAERIKETQDIECFSRYDRLLTDMENFEFFLGNDNEKAAEHISKAEEVYKEIIENNCLRLPSDAERGFLCAAFGFAKLRPLIINVMKSEGKSELEESLETSKSVYSEFRKMGCV